MQSGYQTSPQGGGPGALTSPSGQSHLQQHNPNQASPILPSQTQTHYQAPSQSMGYGQYGVGVPSNMSQGYGMTVPQAAAMATAAASGT